MLLPDATLPPFRHRYAMALAASKRVRWDIDRDVTRGRAPDPARKWLPDALTRIQELGFLTPGEQVRATQVQARTYLRLAAASDRFMALFHLSRARTEAFDDDVALETVIRTADEKMKHLDLFRRMVKLADVVLPPSAPLQDEDELARAVLQRPAWTVLGLALHLQLQAQAHYRASLAPEGVLCPLWSDLFLFHWKEEAQHAVLADMAWHRAHELLDEGRRDEAVDALIALFEAFRMLLQRLADADAATFLATLDRAPAPAQAEALRSHWRQAYRWQHIGAGLQEPRFASVLHLLLTPAQRQRWMTCLCSERTCP